MKKGAIKCLLIFSSFIILGYALSLISVLMMLGSSTDTGVGMGASLVIVGAVIMTVSIVGTFVSSIVVLAQTGKLKVAKGITKAASIVGIVGSSLAIIFVWVVSGTTGASIGFLLIIVTFGLTCGAYSSIKKNNGFVGSNNYSQPTQHGQQYPQDDQF